MRLCRPMMNFRVSRRVLALLLLTSFSTIACAADLVALSPQTWDRYIPQGKEVDGIYGDFALANDQIVAVIAHPRRGRNANMTVRDVGGCLIDLTRRDRQSDQLSAFYPGAQLRDLKFAGIEVEAPKVYEAAELDRVFVQARRVTLRLVAAPREKEPDVEVSYTLEDGWPYVLVTTTFSNRGDRPGRRRAARRDPRRSLASSRAPRRRPICSGPTTSTSARRTAWSPTGTTVLGANARRLLAPLPRSRRQGGRPPRPRRDVPAGATDHPRGEPLRRAAASPTVWRARTEHPVRLAVKDTAGHPVPEADVVLARDGKPHAWGRTDQRRELDCSPRATQPGSLTVSALGHGSKDVALAPTVPGIALGRAARGRGGRRPGSPTSREGRSPARCSSSAATGRRAPTSAPTAASTRSRTCTTATTAASAASWSPAPTT